MVGAGLAGAVFFTPSSNPGLHPWHKKLTIKEITNMIDCIPALLFKINTHFIWLKTWGHI